MKESSTAFLLSVILFLMLSCTSPDQRVRFSIDRSDNAADQKYFVERTEWVEGDTVFRKHLEYVLNGNLQDLAMNPKVIWRQTLTYFEHDSITSEDLVFLDRLEYQKGLTFEYSIGEDGELIELLNWPQVKTFVDSMAQDYIQIVVDGSDNIDIDLLTKLSDAYTTQANIEARSAREIQLVHMLYGLEFSARDSSLELLSQSLNMLVPVRMELTYHGNGRSHILYTCHMDSVDLGAFFPLVADKISDLPGPDISRMAVYDTCVFVFDHKTGWPTEIEFWRTGQLDSIRLYSTSTITMNRYSLN